MRGCSQHERYQARQAASPSPPLSLTQQACPPTRFSLSQLLVVCAAHATSGRLHHDVRVCALSAHGRQQAPKLQRGAEADHGAVTRLWPLDPQVPVITKQNPSQQTHPPHCSMLAQRLVLANAASQVKVSNAPSPTQASCGQENNGEGEGVRACNACAVCVCCVCVLCACDVLKAPALLPSCSSLARAAQA